MSKRLIIILVLIAGLMFAVAQLTDGSGQKESKVKDPLATMVGKPAPEFTLKSHNGKQFTLNQQRGKKVILFFNEGIMCYPACWNQMAALGSDPKLNSDQVVSVSIVNDQAEQWAQAVKKMPELGKGLILLDTDKRVVNMYGMLNLPSSMHKGGMAGHTYLILDEQGIVRYTLDDPAMAIQNETLINELTKL
ncbi:redoxin domain-containing protein [Candidatus Saccharibacteria bacterium]|nr:redoxin domain-containing protein [Candidatus Saccharibacteria bacterium]